MMTTSFHERSRNLLLDLASGETMSAVLARLGRRHGWPPDLTWQRVWGRIEDPVAGRFRLLFQATGRSRWLCTIEIGAGGDHRDPVLGPLGVTRFPADPRLPGLTAIMAEHPGAEVVRYRPGKRCTFRSGRDSSRRFVKVFADGRAEQLHADGEQLWLASQRHQLDFDVARPLAVDGERRCYAQAAVDGRPIARLLAGPDGAALSHRLGHACGSIPSAGLMIGAQHGPEKELARTRRRAVELLSYAPALHGPTGRFLALLDREHGALDDSALRPIHGSPHPDQWLVSDESLGLVDFDRLSLGDPELDVATFAGEVDFACGPDRSAVAQAFEDGYRERHGPLDERRLLVYRAHKRFAKVHRTIRAVRPDGDSRAARHLELAISTLDGGDPAAGRP